MSRKIVRQKAIVERLRGQIVQSRLLPGSRLPTRNELEGKFHASLMTVQRALAFLESEGFVCSRGRNGTFVSEYPPHLWRYSLVFPHHPTNERHWVRFWTALSNEASRIQHHSRRRFDLCYDMDNPVKSDDYGKLEAAITNERTAGIIFPVTPIRFVGTPVLDTPDLPRVAVMERPFLGVPAVALDSQAFIDKALDHFKKRGRKRIAALMVPGHSGKYMDYFREAVAKRGLEHRPWWLQVGYQQAAEWCANAVHLLLRSTGNDRPDALMIADDNLIEHASRGVIESGLRTPDDLDLVGHCNFPWPSASVLPLTRLGFDANEVLQRCIESIDQQRQGKTVPDVTLIPPRFENELLTAATEIRGVVAASR
jgi:DNA-binding LacI/PurR family transcriptional regulator